MSHPHPHSHAEKHFTAPEMVRDVVIGMADGLTVPFALAAGLSGAVSSTRIIVTAGSAEIAAGAIAMGLGAYLAAKSDFDHYNSEFKREWNEVNEKPHVEELEVEEIFGSYGLTREETRPLVLSLKRQPEKWVDFMMRFELGLERPNPGRALASAFTISAAYVVGGFIPLFPYCLFGDAREALKLSVLVTLLALAIFGFVKGRFTGTHRLRSSLQTLFVGILAGAAAYFLARLVQR